MAKQAGFAPRPRPAPPPGLEDAAFPQDSLFHMRYPMQTAMPWLGPMNLSGMPYRVDTSAKSRAAASNALRKFATAREQRASNVGRTVTDEARAAAVAIAMKTAERTASSGAFAATSTTAAAAKAQEGRDQKVTVPGLKAHVVAEMKAEATVARLREQQRIGETTGDVSAASSSSKDPAATTEGVSEKRYMGRIKAFNVANGYGFIHCDEIMMSHGCDVFLNQAVEGSCVVGGTVSFSVVFNKNGKAQARDTVLEAMPVRKAGAEPAAVSSPEALNKVHTGRVKSFNAARGFGFLTCKELQNSFGGRDIFISKMEVPSGHLQLGQELLFRLAVDSKGQPQAKNINFAQKPLGGEEQRAGIQGSA